MHRLRHARFLARLVLAWFALSMGVAAAHALVQPQSAQWLCSGGSMKLVLSDADGEGAAAASLDCPLCGTASAPPPAAVGLLLHTPAALPGVAAHAAAPRVRKAAPPPGRGPPAAT